MSTDLGQERIDRLRWLAKHGREVAESMLKRVQQQKLACPSERGAKAPALTISYDEFVSISMAMCELGESAEELAGILTAAPTMAELRDLSVFVTAVRMASTDTETRMTHLLDRLRKGGREEVGG